MADLLYRIEFLKVDGEPSNEALFFQFRQSPKREHWLDRVRKQDYGLGSNVLADSIFLVAGVTELSIQPFRIWISKSPAYNWSEIILPVGVATAATLGLDDPVELPGSPVELEDARNRLEP